MDISIKPLKGAFKRVFAGLPIMLTLASGPGNIGFSRDGVGHVLALHLNPGEAVDIREHQFLAATDPIEYTFTRVRGAANIFAGSTGLFVDTFTANAGAGIVWVHGYGNVFEVTLKPGEQMDIEPGGWIYKDPSVQMETIFRKSRPASSPAVATSSGTVSPAPAASPCSPCTCTRATPAMA